MGNAWGNDKRLNMNNFMFFKIKQLEMNENREPMRTNVF